MKVLMIGPARNVNGGVSAVVNDYYSAGLDREIELDYIGTMEDGSKWHKLLVAIKALFRFLFIAGRYDIVHVHMASDISIFRKLPFIWTARLYGKIIIIHQHGGNIEDYFYRQCKALKRRMIKKTLEQARYLLVIAPYLQDFFSKVIDKNRVILLPNSVFIPEQTEKCYQNVDILFLGRLCREKGIGELLTACSNLRKEFPALQLYLGGIWEDQELKKQADSLGNWVHQPGWVGPVEKDHYLRKCNIFVLPSYFEGHPVSLLEGMAYQCACIGTDIGGITQMLTDEKSGLVVPAKDTVSLENALRRYLEDPLLQTRLGQAAKETIKQDYDLGKNIKKLTDLYKSLCEK